MPPLFAQSCLRKPGLKTAWLYYFVISCQQAGFEKAARSLGMTPQGLRRNLDQLEAHLSVKLLHRNGTHLQLTPLGQAFFEESQTILDELWRLSFDRPRSLAHSAKVLNLGWSKGTKRGMMPALCALLRARHPQFQLKIRQLADQTEIEQALLSGELDMALGWKAPENAGIAHLSGQPSPYLMVSAPWVTLPGECWYPAEDELLRPLVHACETMQVLATDTPEAMLEMALSGLCTVYLPEYLIRHQLQQKQLAVVAGSSVRHEVTPFIFWTDHGSCQLEAIGHSFIEKQHSYPAGTQFQFNTAS
ncbi:MAG: LysR family transcriptional regulator [Candidatus Sericytochromatia bacterium]